MPKRVARGQQVGVVGPQRSGRGDYRQFARRPPPARGRPSSARSKDTPPLRRARRSRLAPAADSAARSRTPTARSTIDVFVQDRRLKFVDVLAHALDRRQKLGRGFGDGPPPTRSAARAAFRAVSVGVVDPRRIVEHRVQTTRGDVMANPLDHLRRREGLAEHGQRLLPPGLAHQVAARAQPLAQRARERGARKSSRRASRRRNPWIGPCLEIMYRGAAGRSVLSSGPFNRSRQGRAFSCGPRPGS